MERLKYREEVRGPRLLIIDETSEMTPEALAAVFGPLDGAPALEAGMGIDGDAWVKALPYERTLAREG